MNTCTTSDTSTKGSSSIERERQIIERIRSGRYQADETPYGTSNSRDISLSRSSFRFVDPMWALVLFSSVCLMLLVH